MPSRRGDLRNFDPGPAEGLAWTVQPVASPYPGRIPLSRRFPKLLICPFILGTRREGGGGRPRLIDRPGARLGNFLLLLSSRWEENFREPEAADVGVVVGGGCWATPISALLFPTHSPQHCSKVVGLWGLGIFLRTRFFVLSPPSPEKKLLFASSGGLLQVEVLGEAVSQLGGNQEPLCLEHAGVGLNSATAPGCLST